MRPDNISRRDFLRSSAIGAGALSTGVGSTPNALGWADRDRPNFVYIMSDQQHYQALGCVDPFFDTPSQDQFATDAALFERGFLHDAAVFAQPVVDADRSVSQQDRRDGKYWGRRR